MKEKLGAIPARPGVYIFMDNLGKILYVGKAKVLRNRVRSYFQKASALDDRKSAMMRSVADLEFTVTGNELEALILEANLIKQYKPRYNILLRDDKSYPYLKLTINEKWPRLEVVRRVQKDGARYFGPYVPAGAMWETLSFIRQHYKIPNCRYSLDKRMRPCIQFQIRKCIAPCAGDVDHAAYMQIIDEIKLLLEGNNRRLIEELEKKMGLLSDEMRYEEAAMVRDRINALRSVSESQKIVSPELGDMDVIGLFRQGDIAVFKVFFVRNGVIIGARDFEQKHIAGEKDGYLFKNFMEQFYSGGVVPAPEICTSKIPEDAEVLDEWLSGKVGTRVKIFTPSRGIKRKLVMMAEENSEELIKSRRLSGDIDYTDGVKALLGLRRPPESIGAFDISNISGSSAVGAFIVWRDGGFDKSSYRNISMGEIKGPDDYEMMREMIRRTFSNQSSVISNQLSTEKTKQNLNMPDLIVIDGGREHLNAALGVFTSLYPPLPRGEAKGGEDHRPIVIALAKDPDRVFLEDHEEPILIDDSRPASLLLRQVRDEVHRYAVRYHRKIRSKKSFESALDSIYGLGRQRRFALLEHFGSIDAIKKARVEDIAGIKGFTKKLAEQVLKALNENTTVSMPSHKRLRLQQKSMKTGSEILIRKDRDER